MLPLLPGVYIIRDKSGTIIYIGKAAARIRVSQYFRRVPHDNKVSQMIAQCLRIRRHCLPERVRGAFGAGSKPDQSPHPEVQHPAQGRQGLQLYQGDKDEWPRLSFTLQKRMTARSISALILELAARQMAETAMTLFLLPWCKCRVPAGIGRGRPCPERPHRQVHGGALGKISRENYEQAVKSAVHPIIRYGKRIF